MHAVLKITSFLGITASSNIVVINLRFPAVLPRYGKFNKGFGMPSTNVTD